MQKVDLVLPTKKHEAIIQTYIEECLEHKSSFDGTSGLDKDSFDIWLKKVRDFHAGIVHNESFVPATTFLVMSEHRLVGFVNIRHELNDFLSRIGGHIGYMVRPTEREKGYAKALLKAAVSYCKKTLGLNRLLITCDQDNIASKKTILANQGVYQKTIYDAQYGYVEQYVIETS